MTTTIADSILTPGVQTPAEVQVINMTKRFGSLIALDSVSMTLKPGTFHALLGENGAGKSTLVKCIMGFYRADEGELQIGGRSQSITNPREAQDKGIGMVYQHFTSVPAMSVAENLVLSRFDRTQIINWKQELDRLNRFMATAPFQLPLNQPVAQLAAGQKQKLEILKQLYLNSRILILDEPTSVLTPDEADEVLGLLRRETDAGNLSVLLITHKFREVTKFCQEVTVLRKGKFAGCGQVSQLSISDMANMMIGESPTDAQSEALSETAPMPGEGDRQSSKQAAKIAYAAPVPVLTLQDLHANRDNGLPAVIGVNLTVQRGEIVGIAGVSGNGQKELVEVLAGQRLATAGQVTVQGELYSATRSQMFKHRVFALPEEPLRNACVPHMSVAENIALRTFDRSPQAKGIWLILSVIRQTAQTLIQQFSVKTPSTETPISNLSGGNVQRAVLARELSGEVNLLIAANPCFGLDFAAVDFIHNQIIQARNQGVAVLLVCEDLDELLELSDRVVVMSGGKFVYESAIETVDFSQLAHSMAGH